jgi:hypothetical protein
MTLHTTAAGPEAKRVATKRKGSGPLVIGLVMHAHLHVSQELETAASATIVSRHQQNKQTNKLAPGDQIRRQLLFQVIIQIQLGLN